MELARINSKGRMTIPKRVRDAADLASGDLMMFEVEEGWVTMRKLPASDDAYPRGVQEDPWGEWASAEDEDAWRDL